LTTAASSDGNMVDNDQVDVINTNSWTRKGLVLVPAVLSRSGDQVKDEKGNMLPSQRLSTGELAFVAVGLPPLSTRRYTIVPGRPGLATPFVQNDTMLDNGILSLALDATHGGIRSLRMTAGGQEYVDGASGHHLNEYLYLEGSDPAGLQKNGPVRITVKENGPVLKTLLVTSEAPGCTKLMREVRLVNGFDYAEITNTLDKKPALLNPVPGDYQWANTGGKESVHFAFPFLVPGGSFTLDLPFAQIRPDRDQIPGSCKNWMEVGDWVDLSNEHSGITWATLDAPLVEIGEVSANLLGGQSDPAVWRKVIGTGHELYSWALNNHWETNYRASQEGVISFRYALRPHAAYDPAAATRFAMGMSQPLLVIPATGKGDGRSLLTLSSEHVIVLALRPTDDGKAMLVTLFNAADRMEHTRLDWASPVTATYYSDTAGLPKGKLDGEVEIAPLGVVTLRVEQ
jgi:alpha-mannosidase